MSVSGLPSSLSCSGSSSSSYSSGLSQSVSLSPHSLCYTYESSVSVKLEPIKREGERGERGIENKMHMYINKYSQRIIIFINF